MFKKLLITSVLLLSLAISVKAGGFSLGDGGVYDFINYNWQTGLAYFNNNVPQWLIGATTTSTNSELEVAGSVAANEFCLNLSSPDCITSWSTGGSNDWEFFDSTTITPTSSVNVLIPDDKKIYFRDTASFIHSSSTNELSINSPQTDFYSGNTKLLTVDNSFGINAYTSVGLNGNAITAGGSQFDYSNIDYLNLDGNTLQAIGTDLNIDSGGSTYFKASGNVKASIESTGVHIGIHSGGSSTNVPLYLYDNFNHSITFGVSKLNGGGYTANFPDNTSGSHNFAFGGGATDQVALWGSATDLTGDSGLTYKSGKLTVTKDALVATTAEGLLVRNTTPAVTGSRVQVSPSLILTAQGWATASGGASKSHNFRQYTIPASSATGKAYLDFGYDLNGGGYTSLLGLHSNGGLSLGGTVATTPTAQLQVTASTLNTAQFSGDGVFMVTDSSATNAGALIYAAGNKALGEQVVSFGDVLGTYGYPQFYLDSVEAIFYDGDLVVKTDGKGLQLASDLGGTHFFASSDGTDTYFKNYDGLLKIEDLASGIQIATSTTQKVAFFGKTPVIQQSALTTQLTTITHTEPGTPDYAIQNMTNIAPYGFVTQDEANSLLKVVKNLQTRVSELETRLSTYGLLP